MSRYFSCLLLIYLSTYKTLASGGSPATGGPTATGGSTPAPGPTTAIVPPTTAPPPRQTAKIIGCETKLNIGYDIVTANATTKNAMLKDCKDSVIKATDCNADQVQNDGFKRGSLIFFFDFVFSASGGISPAVATAALKFTVISGSFVVTSSIFGSLTADPTFFKAFEPVGISCYSCANTAECSKTANATHPTAVCRGDQNCWVNSTRTATTSYYRTCGEPCTTAYQTKVCTTQGSTYKCAKCCSTVKCNTDVLTTTVVNSTTGGNSTTNNNTSGRTSITPLLLFVGVILHYTFNENV